jgi:hypothetical protein
MAPTLVDDVGAILVFMPDSDGGPPPRLTEPQRQHLTVALAHLEDAVAEVEHLATAPSRDSALTTELRDLPAGFAAAIAADLGRVRACLAGLARAFGLEPRQQSRAREIQGLLVITIVDAEEAGSKGLRGYGPVDPRLPAVLDPALAELRVTLTRMAARLGVRITSAGEAPIQSGHG